MANISVSLPSDGETVDVADYNTPINTIVNEINGGLDNSNIDAAAAIAGSKLADSSVTNPKMGLTTTSWTPTITPQGSMTYTTVTTTAWYADFGSFYYISIRSEGTTGGTASIGFNITDLPFALDTNEQALVGIADAGNNDTGYAQSISGTELAVRRPAGANWNLGAGRGFIISGILKKA